ncbi:hypothetical protein [Streptomyces sp. NPDC055140]
MSWIPKRAATRRWTSSRPRSAAPPRSTVPIPLDCTDGFNEAYYGRPEMLLDPAARQACSAWSFVDDRTRQDFDTSLRRALGSGTWDEAFGHLRNRPSYNGSLVLLRATP